MENNRYLISNGNISNDRFNEIQRKQLKDINQNKQDPKPNLIDECKSSIDDVFCLLKPEKSKIKINQSNYSNKYSGQTDFATKVHIDRLRNKNKFGNIINSKINGRQASVNRSINRNQDQSVNQDSLKIDQSSFLENNMNMGLISNNQDEEQFDNIVLKFLDEYCDQSNEWNKEFDQLIFQEKLKTDKVLFEQMARDVFLRFDKDGSMQIDFREFKLQSQQVGMQNNNIIKKFFKIQDTKKDGIIDFEEFLNVMNNLIWRKWQRLSNKLLQQ